MAFLIPDPVSGRSLDLNLGNLSSESIPLDTVLYNHFFVFQFFFCSAGVAHARPVLL